MHFIMTVLLVLSLYYFYGFVVEVGTLLFLAVVTVVMVVRVIFTHPRRRRERLKESVAKRERDAVFARLHERVAVSQRLREEHPDDWVERYCEWELASNLREQR